MPGQRRGRGGRIELRLSDVDRAVQRDAGRLFTARVPDVVGRGTFRYRGPLRSLAGGGGS